MKVMTITNNFHFQRGEKMTHDEVQAIIDEADRNGDGKLDYAEFCHMLLNTSEQCVQASRQKAKRLGQQPGQVNSRQRGKQVSTVINTVPVQKTLCMHACTCNLSKRVND